MTPIAARLAGALGRSGAILCFHGVTTPAEPSAGVANVSARFFDETVARLRAAFRVVPLRELVTRHRDGRSTRGLIALTFDDAYANLVATALPLLSRHALPATLFPVIDALEPAGRASRFWWDRVDDLHARATPTAWREFERQIELPDAFRLGQPAEFGPVRPVRQWILASHQGRTTPRVGAALDRLEEAVGFRTAQRSMTWEELADVARDPLFDVGVHTATHAVLPLLDDDELARELRVGYETLRERLTATLPIVAYPYGLFDARTLRATAAAGLTTGLTVEPRVLAGASGALPRFSMSEQRSGVRFLLQLTGAAQLVRDRVRPSPAFPTLPSATT